jgi:plastocyanin
MLQQISICSLRCGRYAFFGEHIMATVEIWLQIENRPWDMCPHNIDRMSGQTINLVEPALPASEIVTVPSINGGANRKVRMYKPLRDGSGKVTDALIVRRYKAPTKKDLSDAWTVPDDRKVNPWDINELDPSESGTMGTIPGATIEANVGDNVIIHFRNKDHRKTSDGQPLALEHRCHSLHPHGVVFEITSDGAYPLSPPDSTQPIGGEAALWNALPGGGVGPFKKGDRVPPDGTFDYHWNTFGWPTTAGVWLYHDHSICDMDNVNLGAIGFLIIHNPNDTEQEVDMRAGDPNDPTKLDQAFLPGGSPTGSPIFNVFFPNPIVDKSVKLLPHQLESLVPHEDVAHGHEGGAPAPAPAPGSAFIFRTDGQEFQVAQDLTIKNIGFLQYRTPPSKQLILQLFHSLQDESKMCINGRQYLGNTPTILSGTSTRMRFGVVGMGDTAFHTFHLHGHRWTLPGADGANLSSIMSSAQVTAVSQFEDTRIFGPANSFVFTINEAPPIAPGSFMRAGGPGEDQAIGEWHMHCHVLHHMMTGMMGSLLIVKGGELATTLPRGVPCPPAGTAQGGGGGPATKQVLVQDDLFSPKNVNVNVGDTVQWVWQGTDPHSVTFDDNSFDSGVHSTPFTTQRMFMSSGTFAYHCVVHGGKGGGGMSGTVVVT